MNNTKSPRMTIRVSRGSLAFAIADDQVDKQLTYTPYTIKSGVSIAANLREAFKTYDWLRQTPRARLLINTPVLMVPIEEYNENQRETMYLHSFPRTNGCNIISTVLPEINTVALFAVNKDLSVVLHDNYEDVKILPLMQPVWHYLHRRSYIGMHRKLYAYFHDNQLEIFSFERNRFVFSNKFDVKHEKDALYFILFVWKELALDQLKDELHLAGDIINQDALTSALQKHLKKVSIINAGAEFNRAPLTEIKGITFDLISLYLGQ